MKQIIAVILLCAVFLTGCSHNQHGQFGTDSFAFDWEERYVEIEQVQQPYEIWFFSDSHITYSGEKESVEIQNYAAERKNVFVNEKGVDSAEIFSEFIRRANEEKPDMVLFGGDILDFPSEANVEFLKEELEKLTVPYVAVMGNHDWTFPWEYMTPEGSEKYRPLYDDVMYGNFDSESIEAIDGNPEVLEVKGNDYAVSVELQDLIVLAIDDSSNQVAGEALTLAKEIYEKNKPIVLLQHVPFSTENLIAEAKNYWANPVTLGMQVHGGIAPNDASAALYSMVRDDNTNIRLVLAGHVHFPYEEKIKERATEIITDAAYKGKAAKVFINSN